MVESLYREYRDTHPERFRIGKRVRNYNDALGRSINHPCFGCIVDIPDKLSCGNCEKSGLKKLPRQTKLNFE